MKLYLSVFLKVSVFDVYISRLFTSFYLSLLCFIFHSLFFLLFFPSFTFFSPLLLPFTLIFKNCPSFFLTLSRNIWIFHKLFFFFRANPWARPLLPHHVSSRASPRLLHQRTARWQEPYSRTIQQHLKIYGVYKCKKKVIDKTN